MKIIYDDFPESEPGLLSLDPYLESTNDLDLDLWGFEQATLLIDLKKADFQEININKLKITTHNFNTISFLTKKYKINIKELEVYCSAIHIIGSSLNINSCQIWTTRPSVTLENFEATYLNITPVLDEDEEAVRRLLGGVEMIPGCGEFVLDQDYSLFQKAFDSLRKMKNDLLAVEWISPVVSWFASSLSLKECEIKPGIDKNYTHPGGYNWQVGNYSLDVTGIGAPMSINQVQDNSIYGGTINDNSVVKYLEYARSLGFKIIFYPLIMVNQNDKPWRGHIGTVESSSELDIENFYEKEYKPFVLHYANLVKGKVDAFIIGSELIGLTALKTENNRFTFVDKLIELAGLVRQVLGPGVKLTYAADWSEYHSTSGGLRPLDELWASPSIDFVGIDAYFPLAYQEKSRFTLEQIKEGWQSGEGYDFYLKDGQKVEFKKEEPWTQWKNLAYWWYSEHWAWDNASQQSIKTSWQPKMKPIWFTEFGFPSIDKAPNKPNVFYNPECSDSGVPTFSNARVDYMVQRLALRATLEYWKDSEFVENMVCWSWDARGKGWMDNPDFADGYLWKYGHWIDGKIGKPNKKIIIKAENVNIGTLDITAEKIFLQDLRLVAQQFNLKAAKVKINHSNLLIGEEANWITNILSIVDSNLSGNKLVLSTKGNLEISDRSVLNFSKAIFNVSGNVLINDCGMRSGILGIKAENLTINSSVIVCGAIIIEVTSEFSILLRKWTTHESQNLGKTVINTEISYVTTPFIEATQGEFLIGGSFIMAHATLRIKELYVKAGDIDYQVTVTKNHKIDQFTGGKDFWGRRKCERTETIIETAHRIEIIGHSATFIVNKLFKAKALRLIMSELHMEAEEYQFSGVILEHSNSVTGKKKGGFFSSGKRYGNEDRHQDISGVEIIAANQAYIISEGKIWLEASSIKGDKVDVKAKEIELKALVGTNFHHMWVSLDKNRLSLTCSKGELSAGIEKIYSYQNLTQLNQYLAPSSIIGFSNLDLETEVLKQHGSIIGGGKGRIKALEWQATAPELLSITEAEQTQVALALKIGLQENVTNTGRALERTVSEFGTGGDYALINTASNIYASARGVIGLASGGILSPVSPISANINTSRFEREHITYGMSRALFDQLEADIEGNIEGELEIATQGQERITAREVKLNNPEDRINEESSNTGFGISTTGISVNHYQEKNGQGFGFGMSMGFDQSKPFCNEYRLQYKNGDNKLDASFSMPSASLWQQDFSPQAIAARATDNVNRTLAGVFGSIGLEYSPLILPDILTAEDIGIASGDQDNGGIIEQVSDFFSKIADGVNELFSDDASDDGSAAPVRTEVEVQQVEAAIIVVKATELGYSAADMRNDQALEHTADLAKADLSISEWKKISKQSDGVKKVFADNMISSLTEVREDIISGARSFDSYWQETKQNVTSGETSFLSSIPDGAGNLLRYVEGKVGNVISNNLPKIKAGFYATLGTGAVYALDGAKEIFGEDNINSVADKIILSKEWVDENSTPGQQKAAEYILGVVGAATIAKIYGKGSAKGKLPHVPEGFVSKADSKIFTSPEKITEVLAPLHKKGQSYFDSSIATIEESIFNKAKFDDLPSVIKKDFAELVKLDKKGKVVGIAHMQNHHLLPKAVPEFEELFRKASWHIDDNVNRVFLPDGVAKGIYPTDRTMHSGPHKKEYSRDDLKKAKYNLEQGKLENWGQELYQNEIMKLVEPKRAGLKSGKIELNDAKTLLEKVTNDQK